MTLLNDQNILDINVDVEYQPYLPAPLSYFFLKLLEHLNNSYPHLAADFDFIANRDEMASIVFQIERSQGSSHEEAMAKAEEVLFIDLHFSLHDTIVDVLEVEYSDIIPAENAVEVAISLYSQIEPLLENYNINAEFSESEEYRLLYTEVVGKVLEIFDNYGI